MSRCKKRKCSDDKEESLTSKCAKNEKLYEDAIYIVEVLKLSSDLVDVLRRLNDHIGREDPMGYVIEELLAADGQNETLSNSVIEAIVDCDDGFVKDLSIALKSIKEKYPDSAMHEELVSETLKKYSSDPMRVFLTIVDVLDKIKPSSANLEIQNKFNKVITPTAVLISDSEDDDDDDDAGGGGSAILDEVERNEARQLEGDMYSLRDIFPDVQVPWLMERLTELADNPDRLQVLIEMLSERSYPKVAKETKDLRKEMESMHFDDDDFLRLHPDPIKFFYRNDQQQQQQRSDATSSYKKHSLHRLMGEFVYVDAKKIEEIFNSTSSYAASHSRLLSITDKKMSRRNFNGKVSARPKKYSELPEPPDEAFYKELWFVRNEERLMKIVNGRMIERLARLAQARADGALLTCPICFDDEVIPEDLLQCTGGHEFCGECVKRSVEVGIGEGRTRFPCLFLGTCDQEFSLAALMVVLPSSVLNKVLDRRLQEDLKSCDDATDIVHCPFCTFVVSMPNPNDRILKCQNPECLRESCRLCQEPVHIPLRCEEVEKSSEMDYRKKVEADMTEAMLRSCPKCGKKFIKEDGCNKMTCMCGATMCYVCRAPNIDYNHFNETGCQLHSDAAELHTKEVKDAAKKAKREYSKEHPDVQLKIDPSAKSR